MRNLPIAYGNSCQAKLWSNKTITWNALCEKLKTTIRTTDTVEEYRYYKVIRKQDHQETGGCGKQDLRADDGVPGLRY